jgi:hypothetical protein
MADTFTTSLSIRQIETGTRSGTWGSETNTQYELLDNAFSYVNHDLSSDADATLTISDGTASDARYFYIKFTSSVSLTATRSITLAPDDSKKIWIVENATTGSQSLTFKQGSSGGTVTVVNGNTAVIYADGAGATNGAITNAFTDLQLAGTTSMSVATISGNLTVDTNTLYVDSSANSVGIGTTSPDSDTRLHVVSSGATASTHIQAGTVAAFERSQSTAGAYLAVIGANNGTSALHLGDSDDDDVGNITYNHSSNFMSFDTAATERLRIDSSGNVGIGVSPSKRLDVWDAGGGNIASFSNGADADLLINCTSGVTLLTPTTGTLAFGTSSTERLRIDSSGNLLVGTTESNPTSSAVNVAGQAFSTTGGVRSTVASNPAGTFNRKTDNGDIAIFRKDGTTVGSIGSEGGDSLYIVNGDTGLRFVGGVDSIVPANANGAVRDAAIDIGYSTQRFRDIYLSGGIHLGGTTSANQLDDYEEGTWTPAYLSNGGLATVSGITSASGEYVKIGQFVHLTGVFTLNGSSGTAINPGDYVTITGLPFTIETKYASGTVYTSRAFTNLGGFTGAAYWYAGSYAVIQFLGQGSAVWSGDENETVYFSMNFRDSV